MDLKAYLLVLWRRKWIILVTVATTMAVTVIGTLMLTPQYRASATLRIGTATSGSIESVRYEIGYADRLMNTFVKIATSDPVLAELRQRLNVTKLPEIEAEILANTELMRVTAEDPDPVLASEAANALVEVLVQGRNLNVSDGESAREILGEQLAQIQAELEQARQKHENLLSESPDDTEAVDAARRSVRLKQETYNMLLEQYEQARIREAMQANALSVIEPATVPIAPSKPNKTLNVALGFVVGLVGGLGLAFLFENLDTTVYTTEQIEKATGLPALAKVPVVPGKRPIAYFNGTSPQGEALRHLRTMLFAIEREEVLQTLLVTSAEPGEGKSTIVTSLALAIAQSGREVIVVDGDLRLPTLHERFGLPNKRGLSTVLTQEVTLAEAIQDTQISRLRVLTSGPLPPNPAELLGSPQMAELVEQLKQECDLVLLDTPALLAVADATVLVPFADRVMLVVGRERVRQEAVEAAYRRLADVNAASIFVVVNRAEREANNYYRYYVKTESGEGDIAKRV